MDDIDRAIASLTPQLIRDMFSYDDDQKVIIPMANKVIAVSTADVRRRLYQDAVARGREEERAELAAWVFRLVKEKGRSRAIDTILGWAQDQEGGS